MPVLYKILFDSINSKEDEIAPIVILSGKFEDVIYNYKVVKFNMDTDPPRLTFEYEIMGGEEDIDNTQDFIKVIGDILVDIITNKDIKEGEVNERKDDS
jgi:hypothetical protein